MYIITIILYSICFMYMFSKVTAYHNYHTNNMIIDSIIMYSVCNNTVENVCVHNDVGED